MLRNLGSNGLYDEHIEFSDRIYQALTLAPKPPPEIGSAQHLIPMRLTMIRYEAE